MVYLQSFFDSCCGSADTAITSPAAGHRLSVLVVVPGQLGYAIDHVADILVEDAIVFIPDGTLTCQHSPGVDNLTKLPELLYVSGIGAVIDILSGH